MLERHNLLLQSLVSFIGYDNKPHVETGRKFDKVFVHGKVTYFVARHTLEGRCEAGDIFGAKSDLAPNLRHYFGNLGNCSLWDWSGDQPKPVNDPTVMAAKKYGAFVHYMKVPVRS